MQSTNSEYGSPYLATRHFQKSLYPFQALALNHAQFDFNKSFILKITRFAYFYTPNGVVQILYSSMLMHSFANSTNKNHRIFFQIFLLL